MFLSFLSHLHTADLFPLTHVQQLVEGVVELLDGLVGHPVDAVEPELVHADVAVA